jgi:hypothetical protein
VEQMDAASIFNPILGALVLILRLMLQYPLTPVPITVSAMCRTLYHMQVCETIMAAIVTQRHFDLWAMIIDVSSVRDGSHICAQWTRGIQNHIHFFASMGVGAKK